MGEKKRETAMLRPVSLFIILPRGLRLVGNEGKCVRFVG